MGGYTRTSINERFWNKVTKTHSCWEWNGYTKRDGYGRIYSHQIGSGKTRTSKNITAHRFSWKLHYGTIPDGKCVCHHCDNRGCVRPNHLFLGSQSDNLIDALKKGRAPNMKLCELDVEIMRMLEGVTLKQIADFWDISTSQVWNIVNRKQWKYVP